MGAVRRWCGLLAVALGATWPGPLALSAQDVAPTRTAASVDYVGAEGAYLSLGADEGAVVGDTIDVYEDAVAVAARGRLVFVTVTRGRSIATDIDGSLALRNGDVVFLSLAPPTAEQALPEVAAGAAGQSGPSPRRTEPAASRPRLTGRLALDLDARETRTSWSGDLFGETRRRFATPTTRLSLVASQLPAGLTVRANVRASYRYDELVAGPAPLSVRAYELAAIKSFESVPLELMVGRFANPYESYSAYWDGALVRVGNRSGTGVGVVAGFEPERHDEAPSGSLPKLTAFAELATRGRDWRYDTDASLHLVRPAAGGDRHFVGWTQRVTLGRVTLSQRLRADGSPSSGDWSVTDLRLRGFLDVGRGLRLRGTYRRAAGLPLLIDGGLTTIVTPMRRELTVGFGLDGPRASLSVDGGRTVRDGRDAGYSVSAAGGLQVGSARLSASGRRWSRGDVRSLSIAPALAVRLSSWDWRAGYRLYRTEAPWSTVLSHAAQAEVGVSPMRGVHLSLRAEQQWGPTLSGTRLHLGLWRSF
jgi:hypothetical protein